MPDCYVRLPYRSQGIGSSLLAESKKGWPATGWKRLEVTTPPLPPIRSISELINGTGSPFRADESETEFVTRPVVQRELTGCGIASLAALAVVNYSAAKCVANRIGISATDR